MQIRCPHCHNPVDQADDDPSADIQCSSCGSAFNLARDGETVRYDGPSDDVDGPTSQPEKTLGHFQLLSCLGQGAFGSVWKARDTELERVVAVKIPRAERMSGDEAEMFLREARAAAQVRHPNIVTVHEVGREDGQIYIASDFIEGASLDEWIEAHPPKVDESARLCATIAEALHDAHQVGVVHRDLKPQNILMDVSGSPYITDFGLAKRDAGEVTMTVEGAILGTPAYMPPEQARGDAHKADRRSDVYSLGVILYRLLTGELPFRGRLQMLLVQIQEEEPPSLRKLDGRLPRDLETICLKCLQKDPARRYQTSADLARDLNHWRAGEPITARPISNIERAWRWCRRKPALAGAWATATLLILTLGIGGALFAVQESKNAARQFELRGIADRKTGEAQAAAATARQQTSLAINTLNTVIFDIQRGLEKAPGTGAVRRSILRKALDSLEQIAREFADTDVSDRQTMVALSDLADVFVRVGQAQDEVADAAHSGALDAAHGLLKRADGIAKTLVEGDPTDGRARRDWSFICDSLGDLHLQMGQVARATRFYEQSLALREELAATAPADARLQLDLSRSCHNLGHSAARIGRLTEAAGFYNRSLDIVKAQVAADPTNARAQHDLGLTYEHLGDVSEQAGQIDEARNFYKQSLTIRKTLVAADPTNAEAQRDSSVSYNNLGRVSELAGQITEAHDYYNQAIEIRQTLVDADPTDRRAQYDLAVSFDHLGRVSKLAGEIAESQGFYKQALEVRQTLAAADLTDPKAQRNLSISYSNLGQVNEEARHFVKAMDFYKQSLTISETLAALDPTDAQAQRDLSVSYDDLGSISEETGQLQDALAFYKRSLEISQTLAALDPTDARAQRGLSISYGNLGRISEETGQLQDALGFYRQSLEISETLAALDPTNTQAQRDLTVSYDDLGDICEEAGQFQEALSFYKQSLEIRKTLAALDPADARAQRDLSISYNNLGDICEETKELQEALGFYKQALEIRKTLAATDPADARAQRDLSRSYNRVGDICLEIGEAPEAFDFYKHAFEIRKTLATANSNDVGAGRDLFSSCEHMAEACLELDQPKEAMRYYHQAIDIEIALAAADPNDDRAQRHLSRTYDNLAEVSLEMDQPADAVRYYQQALDVEKARVTADPSDADRQMDLSYSYGHLGDVYQTLFAWQKAAENYQQGMDVVDGMIINGQSVEETRDIRRIFENEIQAMERTLAAVGDWETVIEQALQTPNLLYYRVRAFALQKKIADAEQAAGKYRELAQKVTEDRSEKLYNVACAYGLCAAAVQPADGKALTEAERTRRNRFQELSLTCLRDAIAAGFDDFELARDDSDLGTLRERPEFQTLLMSLERSE